MSGTFELRPVSSVPWGPRSIFTDIEARENPTQKPGEVRHDARVNDHETTPRFRQKCVRTISSPTSRKRREDWSRRETVLRIGSRLVHHNPEYHT